MKSLTITLILAFLVHASTVLAWQGTVTSVHDGDTVTIAPARGTDLGITIRLYGIDAPEIDQQAGIASRDFLRSLIPDGSQVEVISYDTDRYGRMVALIVGGDIVANQAMVENGHAWLYEKYCKASFCRSWRKLQRKAAEERRGLWKDKNPIAPWIWRHAAQKDSYTNDAGE